MIAIKNRDRRLTLSDLAERFGPVPFGRIVNDPVPGTATEKDVLALLREDRLCELVDGVLVEKTMGYEESALAVRIAAILDAFVKARRLGVVAGADGLLRLAKGLVRIPDVSFVNRSRLPRGRPRRPIPKLAPNLAVEVLSEGNTDQEMARKLREYFDSGVEIVWIFDPPVRTVRVYTSLHRSRVLNESQTLTGGAVLPGFRVRLAEIFSVLDEF